MKAADPDLIQPNALHCEGRRRQGCARPTAMARIGAEPAVVERGNNEFRLELRCARPLA